MDRSLHLFGLAADSYESASPMRPDPHGHARRLRKGECIGRLVKLAVILQKLRHVGGGVGIDLSLIS
jgi:hypothetical protein